MLSAPIRIVAVAGVCVIGLIALVISEGAARTGGVEALLPMEAVDPRSLLSGHYVTIVMQERLEPNETCPALTDRSDTIQLAPTDQAVAGAPIFSLANPTATLPDARNVHGTLDCSPPVAATEESPGAPGWVRYQLGVDRFHINQADAERIEGVLAAQNVGDEARAYAILSLGRDGRARLKGLMIDGERLELGWL